ncbi:MAG: hypothetical protein QG608_2960 [Actinomycetota bacterium]|nr:hypothetical protein [Actinomycetota bacterium]
MPLPLHEGLAELRPLLLDPAQLVRAVAAGHTRQGRPDPARLELRPVDLRGGRRLQLVTWAPNESAGEGTSPTPVTRNLEPGAQTEQAIDELLAQPFGNWHVETTGSTVQLRVTKRGQAQVHTARTSRRRIQPTAHDRQAEHLLDPGDPLFAALGTRADKRRQVDAFLRQLAQVVDPAVQAARAEGRPLKVVDLGCGNAYLTFAAHRWLTGGAVDQVPVRTLGIDRRADQAERNNALAAELGFAPARSDGNDGSNGNSDTGLTFVSGTIERTDPGLGEIDVVLALHACDTATDEALARAVHWRAGAVLAAPCCHHDLQRQLAGADRDRGAYTAVLRHAILRERFADVLTDALRSSLLTLLGYRTAVVEFVDSRHTPRNALIRAVRTGARPDARRVHEYRELIEQWSVEPALARLVADELEPVLALHGRGTPSPSVGDSGERGRS